LKEINTHDSDKTSFPKLSIHVSVGNSKDWGLRSIDFTVCKE
jgi:hypothetical protein